MYTYCHAQQESCRAAHSLFRMRNKREIREKELEVMRGKREKKKKKVGFVTENRER